MTTALSSPPAPAPTTERPPRLGLARALVVVGVVAATGWWVTWAASNSILSVGRSQAIGEALVDDDTVREDVARQVRDAMVMSGATALGFTEADMAAAADAVARDPSVAPSVAERVADAHRDALAPPDEYVFGRTYDDQAFVDASIKALEAERPDITIPGLQWLFTTTVSGGFPDLTGPADTADRWRTPLLVLAIAGFVGSAIVHPDRRPRRWLARWCLVAGTLTLVVPFVGPLVLSLVDGWSSSVGEAVVASLGGGLPRRGGAILVALGAVLSLGTWAKQARTAKTADPRPRVEPAPMPRGPIRLGPG